MRINGSGGMRGEKYEKERYGREEGRQRVLGEKERDGERERVNE